MERQSYTYIRDRIPRQATCYMPVGKLSRETEDKMVKPEQAASKKIFQLNIDPSLSFKKPFILLKMSKKYLFIWLGFT